MPRESGASSSHVSWPGLSRPSCLGMHGACISEITGTRRKRAGPVMTEEILRLRDMPGAVEEAVAGDVARLLVVLPGVERLALVCDLLGAVVACDDGVAGRRLGIGCGRQRWPVAGAWAVAGRLAAGVLIERIERHAFVVGEHLALGAVAGLGLREGDGGQKRHRDGGDRNEKLFHLNPPNCAWTM